MSESPKWFTEESVLGILSKYYPSGVNLCSWSIKPATSKGENFGSSLNVLDVKYSCSNGPEILSSFIVKCKLENELMDTIESDFSVFKRETQVYEVIIKEIQAMLESIGDPTILAPKSFYFDEKMIVLENLKETDYAIEDVKIGLEKEQALMILEKLAKFHGCSMVLYEKYPEMFKYHLNGNVTENENPIHTFYINAFEACIKYCEGKERFQDYIPKLKEMQPKIIQELIKVFSRGQKDRFYVLNHGDCWVNNFMFRNKTEDVRLIDFQEGFFGSPGIDLNYFFCSSLTEDTYKMYKNELITKYHKTLSEVLKKVNYEKPIPTMDDVLKEIASKGFHGLATVTATLPILINTFPEYSDIMNFIEDTEEAKENRMKVFSNPRYENILVMFLLEFVKYNIF
ncbi:hypothetical protein ACFFRR_009098 [Megaselia abdita]